MKFSVVIPALNEEQYIGEAVEALCRQDIPRDQYEIIVVDNGSQDATGQVALVFGADKVVVERTKGTNIARQRGIDESRGEIIAFLDADCVAPTDWLSQIGHLFSNKDIAAVSGPCVFGTAEDKFYTIFPALEKVIDVAEIVFDKKAGLLLGGNFAIKRDTLDKIGKLPPVEFFGDDASLAMVISRKAGKVLFDKRLIVKSSPRRFKEKGTINVVSKYAWHYIKSYFETER